MKILLLITSLGMGGAERQVVDLADVFTLLGHNVLLVCLTGETIVRPTDPAIRVINLKASKRIWTLPDVWTALNGVVRDFDPDVVHSHLVHANLFARLLRLTTPVRRLVSSAHNTNEEGWWRMVAYRLTDRLADVSTNVSREAVEAFERWRAVSNGKMLAVYNGVPTSRFKFEMAARKEIRAQLGAGNDTKLIVAVGRLCPQKDYPNLIRAVVRLHGRYPKLMVAIAGDGPLREELLSLAIDEGLSTASILFLGIRHDVQALMSAADVFALSSAWEGFGLVVAEAMACERVVVATDCGGVREVMGDTGFLVVPGDPLKLAIALDDALRLTSSEREARGHSARLRVEQLYSIEAAAERWLEIYCSICPTDHNRRRENKECAG